MKTLRIYSRFSSNIFKPILNTKRFFKFPWIEPSEKTLQCIHQFQNKGIVVRVQIMETFFKLSNAFNDPNNKTTLTYLTGVKGE